MPMTLRDISELAREFIPEACRTKVELDRVWDYWPAHEIGHFLVANKAEIRRPMYGLDDPKTARAKSHAIAHELAAMYVSWRLLSRVSLQIAKQEIADTDESTLDCDTDPTILRLKTQLLRSGRAVDVPTDKVALRKLLRWKRKSLGLKP